MPGAQEEPPERMEINMAKVSGRIGFFCCFDPSLADADDDDSEIWHKKPQIAMTQELQASAKVSTWLNESESAKPDNPTSASSCQTCTDPDGDAESTGSTGCARLGRSQGHAWLCLSIMDFTELISSYSHVSQHCLHDQGTCLQQELQLRKAGCCGSNFQCCWSRCQ